MDLSGAHATCRRILVWIEPPVLVQIAEGHSVLGLSGANDHCCLLQLPGLELLLSLSSLPLWRGLLVCLPVSQILF